MVKAVLRIYKDPEGSLRLSLDWPRLPPQVDSHQAAWATSPKRRTKQRFHLL